MGNRRSFLRSLGRVCAATGLVLAAGGIVAWWSMIRMSGRSFQGTPPPLTEAEQTIREELKAAVHVLATEIGDRNVQRYPQLQAAADYIEREFQTAGLRTYRDGYQVGALLCENVVAEIPGTSGRILIVGAHYDSVPGCPAANDNASGVAATLALARRLASLTPRHTIRLIGFVNEEPGHFQSEQMGSWVYAKRCRERGDDIVGMISLETIGYFSDAPGSQNYPAPALDVVYPDRGNFISFVSDLSSRPLLDRTLGSFRKHAQFPSEGAALPQSVPGVGWSDHWSFWQHGYQAIMVTDTAPFRYPHYHEVTDTADRLDYDSMARIVRAMVPVVSELAAADD